MDRRIDNSEGAQGAEPGAAAPSRRAVLRAAASAPVILTLMAGPARAAYNGEGVYFPGASFAPDCEAPPPEPPRYNPQDCEHGQPL